MANCDFVTVKDEASKTKKACRHCQIVLNTPEIFLILAVI